MKNILLIRFSSIGDIILTTSVLNSFRSQFPDSKIDFLTLENFAPLLFNHPSINNLLVLPKESSSKKILNFGSELDEMGYDLIVDLHNTLRSKLIVSRIKRTPKRVLTKPRFKRFMLFYLYKNLFDKDFNQINLLHSPVKDIISKDLWALPSLHVSENEILNSMKLIKDQDIKEPYGVCVPGAAWETKMWPAERYIELIKKIDELKKWILIGGPKDVICKEIAEKCQNVIDLHGKTDLRESLAIISKAKIAIGSDTGMLHAAEALGVSSVTILGPTSRETGAGVTREYSKNVEFDVWCRPCSQNGSRKCYRKEQVCMTSIEPEAVYSALKSVIGN